MASTSTYQPLLEDPRRVAYADSGQWLSSEFASLTDYYCQECGYDFTASDAEHCPACGSVEVQKAH